MEARPLVLIEWADAYTVDDAAWNEIPDYAGEPEKVKSVGWLLKETDHAYVIAAHIGIEEEEEDEEVGGTMVIPKGMVTNITWL